MLEKFLSIPDGISLRRRRHQSLCASEALHVHYAAMASSSRSSCGGKWRAGNFIGLTIDTTEKPKVGGMGVGAVADCCVPRKCSNFGQLSPRRKYPSLDSSTALATATPVDLVGLQIHKTNE